MSLGYGLLLPLSAQATSKLESQGWWLSVCFAGKQVTYARLPASGYAGALGQSPTHYLPVMPEQAFQSGWAAFLFRFKEYLFSPIDMVAFDQEVRTLYHTSPPWLDGACDRYCRLDYPAWSRFVVVLFTLLYRMLTGPLLLPIGLYYIAARDQSIWGDLFDFLMTLIQGPTLVLIRLLAFDQGALFDLFFALLFPLGLSTLLLTLLLRYYFPQEAPYQAFSQDRTLAFYTLLSGFCGVFACAGYPFFFQASWGIQTPGWQYLLQTLWGIVSSLGGLFVGLHLLTQVEGLEEEPAALEEPEKEVPAGQPAEQDKKAFLGRPWLAKAWLLSAVGIGFFALVRMRQVPVYSF